MLCLAISGDGHTILTGSASGTLRVWDLASTQHLGVLRGHVGAVTSCDISCCGKICVSGAEDSSIRYVICRALSGLDQSSLHIQETHTFPLAQHAASHEVLSCIPEHYVSHLTYRSCACIKIFTIPQCNFTICQKMVAEAVLRLRF